MLRATATSGRVAEQAALAAGDRERRRLRGHREVARGDELAAGGGRQGVDAGDDRLRDRLHRVHQRGAHGEQVAGIVDRRAGHVAEVVTGGEDRAVRGEDDTERIRCPDVLEASR